MGIAYESKAGKRWAPFGIGNRVRPERKPPLAIRLNGLAPFLHDVVMIGAGAHLDAAAMVADAAADKVTLATTIVSSSMLGVMAADKGVDFIETLTGFKWIGAKIAIPMHYRTFPILDQDASKFTPTGIEVMEIEPGSSIEL